MNKYYNMKKVVLLFIVAIVSNTIAISQNSTEAEKLLNKVYCQKILM